MFEIFSFLVYYMYTHYMLHDWYLLAIINVCTFGRKMNTRYLRIWISIRSHFKFTVRSKEKRNHRM